MRRANGGARLRVVVDTNVYVSLFLYPDRPLFHILEAAGEGRYRLLISPAIVREIGKVWRETFGVGAEERARRLKQLVKITEMVIPQLTLDVIPEDPADNRILECAVAGKADLIVSGDRHLRKLKSYEGIPIVRPVDFRRTLGLTG